jgi:hypothetical protein
MDRRLGVAWMEADGPEARLEPSSGRMVCTPLSLKSAGDRA